MKVLIIDDEIKVCNLIMNLVDWGALGLTVVGVANDGKSAYEKIETLAPDIVITDIRMPGYTGIELIERVRQDGRQDIHFIIISGYRQFEYANQAIKFGVEDYLLKPLKQAELERILQKIVEKHEAKIVSHRQQESMARQIQQSAQQLKEHFLLLLFDAEKFETARLTLPLANEAYHCHFQEGLYQLLLVQAAVEPGEADSKAKSLLEKKVKDILESHLEPVFQEIVLGLADGYVSCLLNGTPAQFDQWKKQMKQINTMILSLRDFFEGVDLSMAVSNVASTFGDLPRCAREARVAMMQRMFAPTGTLLECPGDQLLRRDVGTLVDARFRAEFKKRVTLLDVAGLRDAIAGLYEKLRLEEPLAGWTVAEVYRQLLSLFAATMRENGAQLSDDFLKNAETRLRAAHSLGEAMTLLKNECLSTMEEWKQTKDAEDTKPIRKAKQFIHDHYAEPLSLNAVAAEVGLNPSYFSTLFKKETGSNFLDYLMEIRIDVAKELLVETDMSIGEIAEKVGYNDMKYFYKRFRQYTGVSLREYRKLYN